MRRNITAEIVWRNRYLTWQELARLLDCSDRTILRRTVPMGFRRDTNGRMTHAPCARCEVSMPVERLTWTRRCEGCRRSSHPYAVLYRQELARWKKRQRLAAREVQRAA